MDEAFLKALSIYISVSNKDIYLSKIEISLYEVQISLFKNADISIYFPILIWCFNHFMQISIFEMLISVFII